MPPTNRGVYFGSYRVPGTNRVLSDFGFRDETERDFLFKAYGKKTVIDSIALYFGARENAHLYEPTKPIDVKHVQAGLVATMESIRTGDKRSTEEIILGGDDIASRIQAKYSDGRLPTLRVRNEDDEFRLGVICYLVGKYILGNIDSGVKENMVPSIIRDKTDSYSLKYGLVEASLTNRQFEGAEQHYNALLGELKKSGNPGKGLRYVRKRFLGLRREAASEVDVEIVRMIDSFLRELPKSEGNGRRKSQKFAELDELASS